MPEDMKTPEMCRRALAASAELGYGHLALLHYIPFAEVCMEAIRDWYGEGRADLYEVASAIRPEVFDGKMADFLVAEDGRCLSLLPVHLQTPERAAKAGGGVGGVRPPFRPGEAGIENAGAVAEMRRT